VLTLHHPANMDDPAVLANLLAAVADGARARPVFFQRTIAPPRT
jgi:hypothetical protein